MASTFSDLGIELMSTGENAGTWGDKTNTNLQIVEKAIAGYVEVAVTSGGTKQLTITDGTTTESDSVARHAVIKLTGTISGNSIVTVPDSIEKVYIVTNGTSGAYTVQFKTVSGTGITFGVSEKTTRLVYSDGTNLVDAGFGGSLDVEGRELVLDADGDTSITADTDDQIDIKVAGSDQIKITDGAIIPSTDNDIDLGTSSLEFKDAFFDGTVTADAFAGPLTGDVTGNVSGSAATVTTAAQSNITSLGTLTTLTVDDITINGSTISDSGDFTVDGGADIILDADGGDIFFKDGGTTFGSATNTSGNLIIKSGTTTALTFSGANVTVAGDLTVSGDDITMGTNTAGNILVADGTNFNSIAATSLSEISTIANDDVFLAVDTSGGGLKKVARSTVVSGLATSAAISNVSEDTTPQLGGNLDMNGADIVTTSNATIDLAPNGTGTVVVRGNTNSGAIVFNCESNSHGQKVIAQPHSAAVTNTMLLPAGANSTLVSLVSTDTLTNKTLTSPKINEDVAVTSTATELNILDGVTSTTAELNILDGVTSTAAELNILDGVTSTAAELNILDGVTSTAAELNALDGITAVVGELNALDIGSTAVGTAVASKAVILDSNKDYTGIRNFTISGELDAATLDISGDADIDGTTNLDVVDIDGAVDMASTLQVDGAITSSAGATITVSDNSDVLQLISTDADGTTGPVLNLFRNSGSPADGDNVGFIRATGKNDADETIDYTQIYNSIVDASDGTEDGAYEIYNIVAGTIRSKMKMDATETVFNNDSVDLDFRVETNAEANAFKIDGGSETAAFGVPVTFNDAANVAQEAITSSSNAVAWDATDKPNAFHLTTENTTFSAPSNAVEGAFIAVEINYNGSHTIAFNTVFEFAASTAPTTTDTDGKTDILVFRYNGSVWQEVGRTLNLSES